MPHCRLTHPALDFHIDVTVTSATGLATACARCWGATRHRAGPLSTLDPAHGCTVVAEPLLSRTHELAAHCNDAAVLGLLRASRTAQERR